MSTIITDSSAERLDYLKSRPSLTAAEVVELGGGSLSTVRRAIDRGDLPVRRIGRRVLIPTTAAIAWLTGAA